MFSIVIPLYNKQDSITNTLNSVLNQTFTDFEIVIVNDGSTDNSLAIVQKFNDPRIKIIDKPNGGVSSARNKGIREATKEWICFLDGDDLWKVNHLEEYQKIISENNDLTWLFSGYTSKNTNKEYNFIYNKSGKLDNVIVDLLNGIKIHTSTVCIIKSLYTKYKDLYFTEGINNSEDREVWYKLCCIDQSPYYINKSLSIYTLDNPNSLTKSNSINKHNFLTMFTRLRNSFMFSKLENSNKFLLEKYIQKYNINAIKGVYSRNYIIPYEFKEHLPKLKWLILNNTVRLPELIKKIIVRII